MSLKNYSANGKYLEKAFSKYSLESQINLSQKYTLLIKNAKFKFNDDYDIDRNIERVKKLTPKERTIVLCGVKYRLSYKRFYIIQFLLKQRKFDNMDYSDAWFSKNHFTSNQRTTAGNIKSFISKLKSDLIDAITDYYVKIGNFEEQDRVLLEKIVDKLIHYKMKAEECAVKTSFVMQYKIHKL